MSTTVLASRAASISADVGAPPNIIQTIIQILTQLLGSCPIPVPPLKAPARVANLSRLDQRKLRRVIASHACCCPPEVQGDIEAAVLDQAATLTVEEWANAYTEAGVKV